MNVCKRKIHNMDLRLIQAVHPKADTGGNLLKEKKKKDLRSCGYLQVFLK